ncbi:heme biosynthesis HemY N-terminal domain-containing protein [Bradyrhizobium sp. LHD-71]|uniref:heme biosynthesis protein HemY n=1 Tax=Bradyrhizobium sp. LHD-71 TaxID=3072141 RepID=UPI00280FA034|nr:heme biosynthesis HemY N-terminal domain-containing protein [Bradyrhizobium sp. LHD-71]MDQ8729677.1 heme biosynthesis HemY N-terminal domain-containing protein [Bradyrhizobium sp. LHD-71]
MIRIIVFLVLAGAAGLAAAWIADQHGDIQLLWSGWRISTTLPVAILGFGLAVAAALLLWTVVTFLSRLPRRMRMAARARREARGRDAISKGLIAIGAGDQEAARRHANVAERHAAQDPLMLMLSAQAAQMSGDREGARRAFYRMAERADTRLLGLRGLFIEAQRNDDPVQAVVAAEEALKVSPRAAWASHAVLGFHCARADWSGALSIIERNYASGAIDKAEYRRQRAVLLTARALELERSDRDASRDSVMEAVKLAPTLIPAATLTAKYLSESQQTRRAMQVIEAAWQTQPHPDLADAYAHVRLGDSALERLRRIERLADKTPGDPEGALGIARVAADAREFARARAALAPLIERPTQRVALLMAEIERGEHDDEGAARAWTLRAVRAAHDPAWTADGYVSDHWRPVSPVTGRLDAFQWMVPVAALPSSQAAAELEHAIAIASTRPAPRPAVVPAAAPASETAIDAQSPAEAGPAPATHAPSAATEVPVPVFRPRLVPNSPPAAAPAIPAVVPLTRAPDDPGVADDTVDNDEFAERPASAQAGGFKGFLARWVG